LPGILGNHSFKDTIPGYHKLVDNPDCRLSAIGIALSQEAYKVIQAAMANPLKSLRTE